MPRQEALFAKQRESSLLSVSRCSCAGEAGTAEGTRSLPGRSLPPHGLAARRVVSGPSHGKGGKPRRHLLEAPPPGVQSPSRGLHTRH